MGRCGGVDRTDFNSMYLWKVWQLLKELILTVSTLRGCSAVLKEMALTVSPLGRYGSLERTDFNSFYFGKCVVQS